MAREYRHMQGYEKEIIERIEKGGYAMTHARDKQQST